MNKTKLKIGCGITWIRETDTVTEGFRFEFCTKENLCLTCQHNLDAVKAHAAAYQKDVNLAGRHLRGHLYSGKRLAEVARDAVLDLLPKELKGKVEE